MIVAYQIERGAIQRNGVLSAVVRYYDAADAEVAMRAHYVMPDADLDAFAAAQMAGINAALIEREARKAEQDAFDAKIAAVIDDAVRDGALTAEDAERIGVKLPGSRG